jgi:hypothetical protein
MSESNPRPTCKSLLNFGPKGREYFETLPHLSPIRDMIQSQERMTDRLHSESKSSSAPLDSCIHLCKLWNYSRVNIGEFSPQTSRVFIILTGVALDDSLVALATLHILTFVLFPLFDLQLLPKGLISDF